MPLANPDVVRNTFGARAHLQRQRKPVARLAASVDAGGHGSCWSVSLQDLVDASISRVLHHSPSFRLLPRRHSAFSDSAPVRSRGSDRAARRSLGFQSATQPLGTLSVAHRAACLYSNIIMILISFAIRQLQRIQSHFSFDTTMLYYLFWINECTLNTDQR